MIVNIFAFVNASICCQGIYAVIVNILMFVNIILTILCTKVSCSEYVHKCIVNIIALFCECFMLSRAWCIQAL